jgi:CHAT domain-containing protein
MVAEHTLRTRSVDSFSVCLARGEFLYLVVDQHGVDVVASLADPTGQKLLEVDTPNGVQGPESLRLVADHPGGYQLRVRSLDSGASGLYSVRIAALRPATAADQAEATAAQDFYRAEQLRGLGDAVSLRAALALYRASLSKWEKTAEALEAALTLRRVGQVAYALSNFQDARGAFAAALARFRRLGNGAQEIKLLNDFGAASRRLDNPWEAEVAYKQALSLSRRSGDRLGEVTALNNLGVLYDAEGEPQQALDAYAAALVAWRSLGNRDGEAATLHNLGACYSLLGRLPEAQDVLERALRLRQEVSDRRGEAATLTALGWIDFLSGDPRRALSRSNEALRLQREVGDRHGEAATLDRRGTILANLGRMIEAQASYEDALVLFRNMREPINEAHVLGSLGWLQDSLGCFQRALGFHQRALAAFRATKVPHSEAFALLGIARAKRHLGDLDGALGSIEEALHIVEVLRGETRSPALRTSFLAVRYDFFEMAIDLLMQLDAREPGRGFAARALEVSERARARSLLDSVAAARSYTPFTPDLLNEERTIHTELAQAERERGDLAAAGSPPQQIATVDRRLRALLLENDELRAVRPTGGIPDPEPLHLEEIRRRVLDRDTALLEIAMGEKRSYIWLVDQETLTARALPGRAALEDLARRAGGLLPRSRERSVQRQATLAADALSRVVLGPVAQGLGTKRLLVVADGALQSIPFAALPTPGVPGRPLLLDREVVQVPSASVLALLREVEAGRHAAPHQVAVVADPIFGPGDPRLGASPPLPTAASPMSLERSDVRGNFLRLPATGKEAQEILSLVVPAERFAAVGLSADRDVVLGGRLAGYRIVHFATHSVLDARHPELSGLALSAVDRAGRPRDGLLRAYEIYGLRLPADLVVLSACRTAMGPDVRGEGMMGLTRAFLHAGAARVLVSLWNVDDEATAELMARFYARLLRDGLPPSRALREAQLSMFRDARWSAPRHWAGFTLQGDWN